MLNEKVDEPAGRKRYTGTEGYCKIERKMGIKQGYEGGERKRQDWRHESEKSGKKLTGAPRG